MATYATHKRTAEGRATTLLRREMRRAKYGL